MTDAPPPQMPPPPPPMPPPQPPPRKEPGFLLCGLMVFAGLIAVSTVGGALASVSNNAGWVPGVVALAAIGAAIYFSVRDPLVGKCILKGFAVVVAAGAVVFGVCLALLSSMYN